MPTIIPRDRDHAAELARRLLEAAGPGRGMQIRTVSQGRVGIAFDVPDDIAAAVLGVPVGEAQPPSGIGPAVDPAARLDDGAAAAGDDPDPAGADPGADRADRASVADAAVDAAPGSSVGHRAPGRRSRR